MKPMKKILAILLSSTLLLASTAAQAQSSISCMYMLMRVYHAELDHCKVTLPAEREDRYVRLRANMEKFIRANAKADPERIIAGIADNEKRAVASLPSCSSDDFKQARQAIDQMTDFSNEKVVNDNLAYKRDPQSGSCGN